jgi:hypothetical protein
MKDTGTVVATAFVTALDGNLTYDGGNVPVYAEINPNKENYYCILSTQTEEADNNKKSFNTECTILVDVVARETGVSYDSANNIAGQVKNIICPTRGSSIVSGDNSFQFVNVKFLSSNQLMIPNGNENLMRRLLRFQLTVLEK